jgi:hypothetical protein
MGNEDYYVNSMYKLIYLCVFSLNNIENKDQKIGPNGETVNDYIKIIKEYHSTEKFDDIELPFEFIAENDFAREHVKFMVRAKDYINSVKSSNARKILSFNDSIREVNIFYVGDNTSTVYKFSSGSITKQIFLKSKKIILASVETFL